MRPLKQKHRGTIMGKFFITTEELKRRVYPDLCFGWLYVTTPMYGFFKLFYTMPSIVLCALASAKIYMSLSDDPCLFFGVVFGY